MLRLNIIRHSYGFIRKTVLYLRNGLCYPVKGLHKDRGKTHGHPENTDDHNDFDNQGLPVQKLHGRGYAIRGNTGKHDSLHLAAVFFFHRIGRPCLVLARRGFLNGNGHFYIAVFLIIFCSALAFKAENDLFRDHGFSFTDTVCIFYNPEITVYYDKTSVIQIGHLFQLRIDRF